MWSSPLAFLPLGVRVFVNRRLEEAAGLSLVALGGFGFLALVSWHKTDPSWNQSTDNPPLNWMGAWGSHISDVLWLTLGLGALLFLVPPVIWGWRLLMHRDASRLVLRVAAWLFATLFAAAFLGALRRKAVLVSRQRLRWRGVSAQRRGAAVRAELEHHASGRQHPKSQCRPDALGQPRERALVSAQSH